MKKVILTLTTALAACLLFISCGTTQKINPEANTKLAILSIYGNAALPWYELDKNGNEPSPSQGLLGKALTSMFDMENPEMLTAEDRLNYAEDYLKKAFYENFNIEAADVNKDEKISMADANAIVNIYLSNDTGNNESNE